MLKAIAELRQGGMLFRTTLWGWEETMTKQDNLCPRLKCLTCNPHSLVTPLNGYNRWQANNVASKFSLVFFQIGMLSNLPNSINYI